MAVTSTATSHAASEPHSPGATAESERSHSPDHPPPGRKPFDSRTLTANRHLIRLAMKAARNDSQASRSSFIASPVAKALSQETGQVATLPVADTPPYLTGHWFNEAALKMQRAMLASMAPPAPTPAATDSASRTDALVARMKEELRTAAADKDAFHRMLQLAFGKDYDQARAEEIRQQTLAGDFSWMPKIEISPDAHFSDVSGTQGDGVGRAAYSQDRDTIYLSQSALDADDKEALKILTEELGHALDARLNRTDAAGDEGEVFAAIMAGQELSPEQLAAMRADNDRGVIVIDGERVEVEFFLKKVFKKVKKAFKSATKAVRDLVSDVWKGIKDFVKDVIMSEWFGYVLMVCQFIPVLNVVVTVINIVRAAYMVYQGVKHGSIAMVLAGVVQIASAGAKLASTYGMDNLATTLGDVASKAKTAYQVYSAATTKDFGKAAMLIAQAYDANSDVTRVLVRIDQIQTTVKAIQSGDIGKAATAAYQLAQGANLVDRGSRQTYEQAVKLAQAVQAARDGDLAGAAGAIYQFARVGNLMPQTSATLGEAVQQTGAFGEAQQAIDEGDYSRAASLVSTAFGKPQSLASVLNYVDQFQAIARAAKRGEMSAAFDGAATLAQSMGASPELVASYRELEAQARKAEQWPQKVVREATNQAAGEFGVSREELQGQNATIGKLLQAFIAGDWKGLAENPLVRTVWAGGGTPSGTAHSAGDGSLVLPAVPSPVIAEQLQSKQATHSGELRDHSGPDPAIAFLVEQNSSAPAREPVKYAQATTAPVYDFIPGLGDSDAGSTRSEGAAGINDDSQTPLRGSLDCPIDSPAVSGQSRQEAGSNNFALSATERAIYSLGGLIDPRPLYQTTHLVTDMAGGTIGLLNDASGAAFNLVTGGYLFQDHADRFWATSQQAGWALTHPVETARQIWNMPAQAQMLRTCGDEIGALQIERGMMSMALGLTPIGPAALQGTLRIANGLTDLAQGNAILVGRSVAGTTLHGSVMVIPLSGRTPYFIQTTTPAMRAAVQGKPYVDPITLDTVTPPSIVRMAPDHIFPVAEIVQLPGFRSLTREQMTAIIQDVDGRLGNIQPLPAPMNLSKGNRGGGTANGDWAEFRGEAIHPQYQSRLRELQDAAARRIQRQIDEFARQNAGQGSH